MGTMARGWTVGLLLSLLVASGLGAQEAVEEGALPPGVAEDVVEVFNDSTTVRLSAPATIPPGGAIVGDVAVLGGPVTVAGEIRGGLLVVNGDLVFVGEGRVTGDVMVVGGEVRGAGPGAVGGVQVTYRRPLRYRRRGDRIELPPPEEERRPLTADFGPAHSRFTIRAGTSYNRVEGFPVMFGPIVETGTHNPFRVEALGVWRSESGPTLEGDQLGYLLRAEQQWEGPLAVTVGTMVHSEVLPIESWGLSELETSLSTFLLHKDYRDHAKREGWSLYARLKIPRSDLELGAEYRDERHAFQPVSSPWTLWRNGDPWRPQPLVGEGDLRTLGASVLYDGRNDREDPTDGWYVQADVTRGLAGDLELPPYRFVGAPAPVADEPLPVPTGFTTVSLDLRRHLRVSPESDLSLRLLAGGAAGATPPPAQFQRALGGEGSLPGYRLFSMDCGARTARFQLNRPQAPDQDVYAAYGCDRTLLLQAQYRGQLDLGLGLSPHALGSGWDWYPAVDLAPSWIAFADLGKGWVLDGATETVPGLLRADTPTQADVGVGVFLGDLGLLWAVPLQGDNRRVNFFVRLSRRF